MELAILILQHIAWLVWTIFAVWYGVKRRWNDTPYGFNLFITSGSMALILTLTEVSIWFPQEGWRPTVRLLVYATLIAAWVGIVVGGAQRIYFLRHEKHEE